MGESEKSLTSAVQNRISCSIAKDRSTYKEGKEILLDESAAETKGILDTFMESRLDRVEMQRRKREEEETILRKVGLGQIV